MDAKNIVHSKTTYNIMRLENVGLLAVCSIALVVNRADVDWVSALVAFWMIDIVGYIPGALVYRVNQGRVSAGFYFAYNLFHTYLLTGPLVALWWWSFGFEWAMLAVPIHYSIDRGVFGNVLKTRLLPFEPKAVSNQELLQAVRGRRMACAPVSSYVDVAAGSVK